VLKIDCSGLFDVSDTFAASDFTFSDGSLQTIGIVFNDQTSPAMSCIPGTICVSVDQTADVFYIVPGDGYTSGSGATITFTIEGVAPDGLVTNSGSVLSGATFDISMCSGTGSAFDCGFNWVAADTGTSAGIDIGSVPTPETSVTSTQQSAGGFSTQTISFVSVGGVANGETITATYPSGYDISAITSSDVTVSGSTIGSLTTAADCTGSEKVGIDVTGQIITATLCSGDGSVFNSSEVVTLVIGTSNQITNPGTTGTSTLTINAAGEVYSVSMSVIDSDQVTISANVDPSITFDINANADNTPEAVGGGYDVPLGVLTTGAVTYSNNSTIDSVWLNLSTNASSGAVVTVRNANGATGLVSTSVPADAIDNSAASMAAGEENYGLCVVTTSLSGFARAGDYTAGTCAIDSDVNAVKGLTTTSAAIVSTTAPVADAVAEVAVNTAISGVTPAHNDYTDTLTFIATGTF